MIDSYDCCQNALAERINGILKMEYFLIKPSNLELVRKLVEDGKNEGKKFILTRRRRPKDSAFSAALNSGVLGAPCLRI